MIFRSNSVFRNMCSAFSARSEKFIRQFFSPTRAAIQLINSFFSYTIYYPPSTGICFFPQLESFFICTVCNSYFSWPVTIGNEKNGFLMHASIGHGYWSAVQNRLVHTAREPSPPAPEPGWQAVGASLR
ncbi:hypothetical protein HJG60_008575 [Phyllostomus discolor]|uniref:Uncharacterized protein n=1 Tax=Phyllostomus discolor TaxID=89673 RepID=A0A833Z120_9CHIR|nr:hypothetical protein HJG60_008575 [Phyllostomus discolor]